MVLTGIQLKNKNNEVWAVARETSSVIPEVSLRNLLINGNILLTWHYPTSYIKTEPNLDTTKYVGVRRQFVEGWANCM